MTSIWIFSVILQGRSGVEKFAKIVYVVTLRQSLYYVLIHVYAIHIGDASAHSSTQPGASTFSAVWPGVIFPAQALRNTKEETTQVLELHERT